MIVNLPLSHFEIVSWNSFSVRNVLVFEKYIEAIVAIIKLLDCGTHTQNKTLAFSGITLWVTKVRSTTQKRLNLFFSLSFLVS